MPTKKYLGIDPGLVKMGYAVVDYRDDRFSLIENDIVCPPASKPIGERLAILAERIRDLITTYGIQVAGCESPSFSSISSTYSLGAVHGIIQLVCFESEVTLYKVAPSQLKKFATGASQASKEKVQKGMKQRFDFMYGSHLTDDAIDASAIGIIAAAVDASHIFKRRAQVEVVRNVKRFTNFS